MRPLECDRCDGHGNTEAGPGECQCVNGPTPEEEEASWGRVSYALPPDDPRPPSTRYPR